MPTETIPPGTSRLDPIGAMGEDGKPIDVYAEDPYSAAVVDITSSITRALESDGSMNGREAGVLKSVGYALLAMDPDIDPDADWARRFRDDLLDI